MATRKSSYMTRPNYLKLSHHQHQDINNPITSDTLFEFDESDVWINNNSNQIPSIDTKKCAPTWKKPAAKKMTDANTMDHHHHRSTPPPCTSLPLNIPDWSKIYRDDFRENSRRENDDDDVADDDDDDGDARIPPHEYLARTRRASFSVHEGIGRTLKGRDLSRVRNAIWKKTGFED